MQLAKNFRHFQPLSEAIQQVRESTLAVELGPTRPSSARAKWLRELLRARSHRAKFFDHRLFADPAWDMLLELYLAHLLQRRLSVSSIGLASGVPPTTALRWMDALERQGLIERRQDPFDGRRRFVSLSPKALDALGDYFASLPPALFPFNT